MAKRAKTKAARRAGKHTRRRKTPAGRRSVKRPNKRVTRKAKVKRPQKARNRAATFRRTAGKAPRLDRVRRILDDAADLKTAPSSLDVDRYTGAARSGRRALAHSIHEHAGMTPALTGGDVDADWENAYFSGDEAPGGDNLTPDQESVEEMGQALGVSYEDNEELKASDKVVERDKHRWELDPASADDYHKNRN
jgi:uncharacterized protein DUF6335